MNYNHIECKEIIRKISPNLPLPKRVNIPPFSKGRLGGILQINVFNFFLFTKYCSLFTVLSLQLETRNFSSIDIASLIVL